MHRITPGAISLISENNILYTFNLIALQVLYVVSLVLELKFRICRFGKVCSSWDQEKQGVDILIRIIIPKSLQWQNLV